MLKLTVGNVTIEADTREEFAFLLSQIDLIKPVAPITQSHKAMPIQAAAPVYVSKQEYKQFTELEEGFSSFVDNYLSYFPEMKQFRRTREETQNGISMEDSAFQRCSNGFYIGVKPSSISSAKVDEVERGETFDGDIDDTVPV